jgi:putative ABC transport system permease protein
VHAGLTTNVVDLASKILLHDKLRFAITLSGVAFSVALVLVQIGLFLGLLDNATVTIQHLPADLWIAPRNTPTIDFAKTFPEEYVDRVRSLPEVERADKLIVWYGFMNQPTGAKENVLIYALENFPRWNFPWNIVEGDPAELRSGRYVFIDESARRRFAPYQVGDYRELDERRVKIIGRSRDALSFSTTPLLFMDYHLLQAFDPRLEGATNYIVVKLAAGADVEAARAELRRRLPYNDVHTKAEWITHSRDYWLESTGLGLNMYVTVLVGCLVALAVVAQTLNTSTMEHLREFGTVKAIGGRNRDVYRILFKQAGISAVLGFTLGLTLTLLMKPVLLLVLDLRLLLPVPFVLAVFAGSIVMCLAAATVSFHKVAKLDPAMVFRS